MGVKQPTREADHSPSFSAEIKSEWSYTSLPPLCLHDGHRDNCVVTAMSVPVVTLALKMEAKQGITDRDTTWLPWRLEYNVMGCTACTLHRAPLR